ncbi:MAG: 3-oxoacyl-ACP reductase FabG [Peptococcaceae bacterium]|jgi:3-oxoacyl-[acyl-carrier protein] reductase|nr:3-oxoacyl-ACP reductase FabG [Peptococcaceae bacterium]
MEPQAKKQIALVTGASGGIGSAIARQLAADGYRVVLQYYKSREACEASCDAIIADGGEALSLACDIRSASQVAAMFDQVEKQWGPVHVLVNNAGIARQELFTDMTEDQWQEIWQTNVSGAIWCSKRALPSMIHAKAGKIINISSIWGMVGASCEVAYSTTKGALISFTKALAKEVGPSGITVNCVAPGVIDTPMNSHLSAADMVVLKEETPLGMIGTPQDVAGLVSFLVSSQGAFITGQIISPNGGFII